MDFDETFEVSGNNVIRTETDRYYKEITIYAPAPHRDGYYAVSETKVPLNDNPTPTPSPTPNKDPNNIIYPRADLYKFDFNGDQVVAAYEFDDGRWELEFKDPNETYSIVDGNIVLTEVEGRWTETSIFSPVGDGTYRKVSENYTQTDQSSGNTKNYDNTDFSLFRLYKSVFDRTPDAPGFGYWQTEYKGHKMSWDGIVTSFLNSKEFVDTYGNTTNEQFVKLLYNNVLKRDPDADGNGYWLDQLNTGVIDREGVVNSFAQSQEFIAKTQSDALSFFDTI